MKNIAFQIFTRLTYGLIWFSDRFFAVPVAAMLWLQQAARVSVATAGYWLMKKIDEPRCKMIEAEAETDPEELSRQGMELKLMESSYKVRDHAKEIGDWTDHHTEAIEAIGNALLLDIGWDERAVEQHMRSVVESIDGLTMDSWFEDED
jgi:hypothetical protein